MLLRAVHSHVSMIGIILLQEQLVKGPCLLLILVHQHHQPHHQPHHQLRSLHLLNLPGSHHQHHHLRDQLLPKENQQIKSIIFIGLINLVGNRQLSYEDNMHNMYINNSMIMM